MTATEHTPGPWYHRESKFDSSVWEIIADCCESPLAEVPRWEDEEGNDSAEAKANLAVITAAPDFVERWDRGDLAEAARACQSAVELATSDSPPWDITLALPASRLERTVSTLLTALEAIIDYAENEAYSLEKLKDSPEAEAEAERAWKAVESAQAAIAQAKAAGIEPAPDDFDIQALLAERRQIAVIWSIEDVKAVAPNLTDNQCWEVLRQAERRHDANIGINWTVLICHADRFLGEATETDASEEAQP
jgi:hypothetical protein